MNEQKASQIEEDFLMRTVELLDKIRPIWIDRVSRQLARGESVRESFIQQLTEYFNLMKQAVITGDPSWLHSVLDSWIEARTVTEIENQDASLAPILSQIMLTTHDVASEILDDREGIRLLGQILPIFM